MYTRHTYQDYLAADNKIDFIKDVIRCYKSSKDFNTALDAKQYFYGENPTLRKKYLVQYNAREYTDDNGLRQISGGINKIAGYRIPSNFFFRFVTQQNQFSLGNGLTLGDGKKLDMLGADFSTQLEKIGENALIGGVCYGFWNYDHIEMIPCAVDTLTGCVALYDEMTSDPCMMVQFWQLDSGRPQYIRVFHLDGIQLYRVDPDGKTELMEESGYRLKSVRYGDDSAVVAQGGYGKLPIIPLYANPEHRSELTDNIRSKIDAYDIIHSHFADNLQMAMEVYWVLNNFGGDRKEAMHMVSMMREMGLVLNQSDGMGGNSSVDMKTIDVPYEARRIALELLEKQLYKDYMALNMEEMTGGSLTNVAIEAAMTNLNMKCSRYIGMVYDFVQKVLRLIGEETAEIVFKPVNFINKSEVVSDLYIYRADIDRETALKKNPYIEQEEIARIIENLDAETVSGMSSVERLQQLIDDENKLG